MDTSNMKNIVVLKNLNSNIVEEAIVVLKKNIKIKTPEGIKNNSLPKEDKIKNNDYIVKEAEMHIAEYVSKLNNSVKKGYVDKKLEKKYNRLKKITKLLAVLAILGALVNIIK